MDLYKVTKRKDGGVKVETILTPDEVKFMLEFALANLMAMGMLPNTVAEYFKTHAEELGKMQQEAVLHATPPSDMGKA